MKEKPCPCCSGASYAQCCGLYHKDLSAPTAIALMRSRYSAYALSETDYLIETTHPDSIYFEKDRSHWKMAIAQFIQNTRFVKLEIHGYGEDWVDFTAHLEQEGKPVLLKEKSHFQKRDGKWLYLSAQITTGMLPQAKPSGRKA
jgi:SEC-C motif-containing protein